MDTHRHVFPRACMRTRMYAAFSRQQFIPTVCTPTDTHRHVYPRACMRTRMYAAFPSRGIYSHGLYAHGHAPTRIPTGLHAYANVCRFSEPRNLFPRFVRPRTRTDTYTHGLACVRECIPLFRAEEFEFPRFVRPRTRTDTIPTGLHAYANVCHPHQVGSAREQHDRREKPRKGHRQLRVAGGTPPEANSGSA